MKKIVLGIVFLLNMPIQAQVKLTLLNDTGARIDSLVVSGTFVGTIEKDSVTTFTCKFLALDGNMPMPEMSGKLPGENVTCYYVSECGTFHRTIYKGEYSQRLWIMPDQYHMDAKCLVMLRLKRKKV